VQDHVDVGVRRAEPGREGGVGPVVERGGLVKAGGVLERDAEVVAHVGGGEIVDGQAPLGDSQGVAVGLLGAA